MNKSSVKAIKRVSKRYRKSSEFKAKYLYTAFFENAPEVDKSIVLFQSFDGNRLGGSPFYILLSCEKDPLLRAKHKIIAVKRAAIEKTEVLLKEHKVTNFTIVELHSKDYCRYLTIAGFLINNSTFPTYFIKRAGQRYMNTWHGTPLKAMGRKIANKPWGTGNTQRNFLMADYLLYPNEYMFNIFKRDYMIERYYNGTYLLGGYPCNSILFDIEARKRVREDLGVDNKKVVVYMPTWRSPKKGGHRGKHHKMEEFLLMNLDEYLDDNAVVFAQSHYYNSNVKGRYNFYKKIFSFPEKYESYELLNIADVLITDYSSVMFDFLNLDREIVLFDYDKEEYLSERGSYLDIDSFPFWATKDAYSLCDHINNSSVQDFDTKYASIKQKICCYDSADAANMARDALFYDDTSPYKVVDGKSLHNRKKNILIFAGALTKNGLTSALEGLLENLNYDSANYLITFKAGKINKSTDFFENLSENVDYLPMQGSIPMSYREAIARFRYYRQNKVDKKTSELVQSLFSREAKRCFPNLAFDSAIHFTGYERDMVHILLGCEAQNRVIFVHSDMSKEQALRGNFHISSIEKAYKEFDRIAVVREGLVDSIEKGFDVQRDKIYVVHNVNKLNKIRSGAAAPVTFDEETFCSVGYNELLSILNDKEKTKYINIGRFSPEKGLMRLISAYSRFIKNDDNSYLIILGGHGAMFNEVLEAAQQIDPSRIIIIKSMSNPYSVLNRSDVFVMTSFYEGLPMSIIEALILHKPVICTSIPGPREFLESGYGYLVPDSEEGIYQGFCDYRDGKITNLKEFDAESFNKMAIEEFYGIIDLD